MKDKKLLDMVRTAVLAAVVLVMAFVPVLGYIPINPVLKVSLIPIPIVIGAMVIGPVSGLILGTLFGLTSFFTCIGFLLPVDAFGAMVFSINPLGAFLMCVPTRAMMGLLTGLLFRQFKKWDGKKIWCYFAGGFSGAFLNTLFFMSVMILFFWNSEYIQGLAASVGGGSILAFVIAFVGINGLIEMPASAIIGGTVSKVLTKILVRSHQMRGE